LIFPNYEVPGLDPIVERTLRMCGVLPEAEVQSHRCWAKEGKAFLEGITGKSDVARCTMDGDVLAPSVSKMLEWLLDPSVDLAVLIYCGHDCCANSSATQRPLVCSYGRLVTAETIDATAVATGFEGTLLRVHDERSYNRLKELMLPRVHESGPGRVAAPPAARPAGPAKAAEQQQPVNRHGRHGGWADEPEEDVEFGAE
jgi:hypothetical protein